MDACALGLEAALAGQPRGLSRRVQMFAAVVIVAVLALMVAGRHPSVLDALRASVAPEPSSGLLVRPLAGTPGSFQAGDGSYVATFDASGFRYLAAQADRPLEISASQIDRGGRALDVRPGEWRADGAAIERGLAPGIVERVTARTGEIEWDVVLGARPAGHGPLRISADLRGMEGYASPTAVAGKPALRVPVDVDSNVLIGEVIVRDALGNEVYRGLPTVTDGQIHLVVPARVLDGAHYPLTVDPTVSAEKTIAPAGVRLFPVVASETPTYFLTVWQEKVGTQYDIYGVLTDADVTANAPPFLISSDATKDDIDPHVAYNGNTFLVTWTLRFSSTDFDVKAQRVSKFGGNFGTQINIATPNGFQYRSSVAGNTSGGPFLVAYADELGTDFDVKARRVTDTGTILDSSPVVLNNPNSPGFPNVDDTEPAAAWDGQAWVVDWLADDHIADGGGVSLWSRYWDPANSAPDVQAGLVDFELNGDIYQPAVAGAGDGTSVVVYGLIKSGLTQGEDLFASHQFGRGFEDGRQTVSSAVNNEGDPSIAFSGGQYLVAWTDRRSPPDNDILAARIKKDGTVVDPNGFAVARTGAYEQYAAVAAISGGKWAVVYSNGTSASSIAVRTVSPK